MKRRTEDSSFDHEQELVVIAFGQEDLRLRFCRIATCAEAAIVQRTRRRTFLFL